jgi:hypothetical protein
MLEKKQGLRSRSIGALRLGSIAVLGSSLSSLLQQVLNRVNPEPCQGERLNETKWLKVLNL